ncbi:MAG: hypothetical protein U0893_20935 [Chloroflexota bacterium]
MLATSMACSSRAAIWPGGSISTSATSPYGSRPWLSKRPVIPNGPFPRL